MQKRTFLWAGAAIAVVASAAIGAAVAQGGSSNGFAPGMPFLGHGHDGARGGHGGFDTSTDPRTGRFVNVSADAANGTFSSLDVRTPNGTLRLLERAQIAYAAGATGTGAARGPGYVLEDGAGDALAIGDAPGARLDARSANGTTVTLALPAGATVALHDAVDHWSPAGATVTYADGSVANLVLRNATVSQDGQTLTVALAAGGDLHYGLVPPEGQPCPGPMGHEMGEPRGEHGLGGPMGGHGPGRR